MLSGSRERFRTLSRRLKKPFLVSLSLVTAAALISAAFGAFAVWRFSRNLQISLSFQKYHYAELRPSPHVSRQWMDEAMALQKDGNYAPSAAARLFAYTASVFSDVLDETHDPKDASAATALILEALLPQQRGSIDAFYRSLYSGAPRVSAKAETIVSAYRKRALSDGFTLIWNQGMVPARTGAWYVRGGAATDGGAMSGSWKPWVLTDELAVTVPPPPALGSIADQLEIQKIRLATELRVPEQTAAIYFWQGSTGAVKGANKDNITPAGVWQNIFSIEESDALNESDYAHAQKILAQSIADSFIYTWKIKYIYYSQRPSMRVDGLSLALADPPFPGYISGHSTISSTAATVLSALFPDKSAIWRVNAKDARYSRILAGIHFDIDNEAGENYGDRMGAKIAGTLGLATSTNLWVPRPYTPPSVIREYVELLAFKFYRSIRVSHVINTLEHLPSLFSKIRFSDSASSSGLQVSRSGSVAWGDYDGDGRLDMLTDSGLYRNNPGGTFQNVTQSVGLDQMVSYPYQASFIDYNNDGCEDVLLLSHPKHVLELLKNTCAGRFVRPSRATRLDGTEPMAVAWDDYNHDGYPDLYVSNWLTLVPNPNFLFAKNTLWKNNGDGTFTDVTDSAHVSGVAQCPQYEKQYFKIDQIKNSYQPIWFDYDNDGYDDLFSATDSGISPLYHNNGDGTFTDVTNTAGMCIYGTGMGVAVADIDHNGYLDLYVTNTGSNYLWMNQGNGTFKEEAESRGVANLGQGWGVHFEDFDNDGEPDLYLVNGTTDQSLDGDQSTVDFGNMDEVYENRGNGFFMPVGSIAGIHGTAFKQSSATADYDNDGRVDVYVSALGHASNEYNALYHNDTDTWNHWVTLRLIGTRSNRDAIGARVELVSGGRTQIQEVINNGSFDAQSSRWLHFGLGRNTAVRLTIHWPSGSVQTLSTTTVDAVLTIPETD